MPRYSRWPTFSLTSCPGIPGGQLSLWRHAQVSQVTSLLSDVMSRYSSWPAISLTSCPGIPGGQPALWRHAQIFQVASLLSDVMPRYSRWSAFSLTSCPGIPGGQPSFWPWPAFSLMSFCSDYLISLWKRVSFIPVLRSRLCLFYAELPGAASIQQQLKEELCCILMSLTWFAFNLKSL